MLQVSWPEEEIEQTELRLDFRDLVHSLCYTWPGVFLKLIIPLYVIRC